MSLTCSLSLLLDCYRVGTYRVQFVDYGNTAVVKSKDLYYLDDKQLLTIPPQVNQY